MTDNMRPSRRVRETGGGSGVAGPTRLVATLVLIPTVPMLLASIAALALFYIAPVRFGNLINRLPGETFIRTALFFAPATLFAVVVLATLYALEKPVDAAPSERIPGRLPWPQARWAAWVTLVPVVPALLASTALLGLSFVSPGRFDRLIEPLPGERFIRPMVLPLPLLLFGIALVATYFAIPRKPGLARLAVSVALIAAVPMLLFYLAALGLSFFSPARFESLITRLPFESFVRLALVFAPVLLLAVVFLAVLYLRDRPEPMFVSMETPRPARRPAVEIANLRSLLGMWVLVGGLIMTTVVGLGLLGVTLYLVLR
jgi:hypothetical protein